MHFPGTSSYCSSIYIAIIRSKPNSTDPARQTYSLHAQVYEGRYSFYTCSIGLCGPSSFDSSVSIHCWYCYCTAAAQNAYPTTSRHLSGTWYELVWLRGCRDSQMVFRSAVLRILTWYFDTWFGTHLSRPSRPLRKKKSWQAKIMTVWVKSQDGNRPKDTSKNVFFFFWSGLEGLDKCVPNHVSKYQVKSRKTALRKWILVLTWSDQ